MEVMMPMEMAASGMRRQMVINTASLAIGTPKPSTRKICVARAVEGPHPPGQLTMARLQSVKTVSLQTARTLAMVQLTLTTTTVWLTQAILACARKAGIISASTRKTCVAHAAEETERNAQIPMMAELTVQVAGARTTTHRHQQFLITNTLAPTLF